MRRHATSASLVAATTIFSAALAGCGVRSGSASTSPSPSYSPVTAWPALPKLAEPAKGIEYAEVALPRKDGPPRKLWIYLPKGAAKKGAKLPVVFIAPAGTPLWFGMDLGDGDRDEHVPYVRAGFAVVAYALDGPLEGGPEGKNDAELARAANAFRASRSGIDNAEDAITYATKRLPIDPARMFVAGHSSAGTVAIQVAEHEPRLVGCVAYMAGTDPIGHWGAALGELEEFSPGYEAYARGIAPIPNAPNLKCPLFLCTVPDDTTVKPESVRAFARTARATNPNVTLFEAKSGGHYDAMIAEGIPAGIRWLGAKAAK